MLRHAKNIFKEPVKSRAITPRVEKKYKAPPTDPVFITSQLPPDSVVVGAARKRANSHTSGDAPPPDKESRKFDAAGKRVAVQAANQWRIANSQALLARYDRAHWDEMQHLIEHLPKEMQKRAKQVVEEGQNISNNQIRSSMDAADTAARTINTSVTIRRHAWLRTSGFKPEIQQAVLNMPFNEKELFGPEVDTAIEKLKKDTDTAKAMGALYSPQSRGTYSTFRKITFRGGFRGQATQASTSQTTPYILSHSIAWALLLQHNSYLTLCGENNRRWSRRPCAMETKGGVTRSRDSKDFFEEKQLVTLRPNTRWRAMQNM
ncbi:hypothetical protein NDU88_004373 [Pleurodeles waltl]|uniref:Uncharacterized protein n=1 Tax=Pleurodeles waltl TaxID=8319 RepID=A0AAV7W7A1_PLEWA|nr:hypothetical protein NDU88_004373 [Pleurodeles waltl]